MLRSDSASGNHTGEYRYDGEFGGEDELYDVSVFDDGKIALTGYTKLSRVMIGPRSY